MYLSPFKVEPNLFKKSVNVCNSECVCGRGEVVGCGQPTVAVPQPEGCCCCCCAPLITVVFRNAAGKNSARPPLKRFVSSAAWVDTEEPSVMMKG